MQFVLLIIPAALNHPPEIGTWQESAMSNRLLSGAAVRLQPSAFMPARRDPVPAALSWSSIRAAWRRYNSRQRIAELDSHLLKDIGVSYADAEAEANKPFWRG
jgi:uncharacterized protein YjiS (DUF1127 family)